MVTCFSSTSFLAGVVLHSSIKKSRLYADLQPRPEYSHTMNPYKLANHFLNYFSVIPANTPELLKKVYRLRYDVYCIEHHYEPLENFPDGMESDEYDRFAKHVLVVHNSSGLAAGCTRLVPTNPATNTSIQLPLEKNCSKSLNRHYLDELRIPRHSICEASRLCVSKSFRRRSGESASRLGDINSLDLNLQEERTFPLISVSISLATTALTELTNHPYMFAMMEPFLPRLLRRIGYNFIQVGTEIDYHGIRAAYLVETNSVLQNLKPELHNLYNAIREKLREHAKSVA